MEVDQSKIAGITMTAASFDPCPRTRTVARGGRTLANTQLVSRRVLVLVLTDPDWRRGQAVA